MEGEKMYCSNCGKKLSPEDYFCSNCGTPVLRQGLFDDTDGDAHDDAFEETRLFTAEELGQYLNDYDDDHQTAEKVEQPIASMQPAPHVDEQKASVKNDISDKSAAAKVAAAEVMDAANVFAGKFKGKLSDIKAKQAEKKQAQAEARAAKAAEEKITPSAEVVVESADRTVPTAEKQEKAVSEEPLSVKKVILPVIVLGLIIGLVIGLVLIQPWSNGGNDTNTTDQTAVSTVMLVE